MIIPDINILVYAYDSKSSFHKPSRDWWEATMNSGESVGMPWIVTLGFLRLVTHPRAFSNPVPIKDALEVVDSWLKHPNVTVLDPTAQHWRILNEMLNIVQVGSKLVSDAHLAAIAREYRATLVTNDRDFERFSGVSILNLLGR